MRPRCEQWQSARRVEHDARSKRGRIESCLEQQTLMRPGASCFRAAALEQDSRPERFEGVKVLQRKDQRLFARVQGIGADRFLDSVESLSPSRANFQVLRDSVGVGVRKYRR